MTVGRNHDRTQTLCHAGRRQARLARHAASFLVRRIPRPRAHGLGRAARLERRRDRAGTGFPPHPHADMEIITYVRQGAISHEDSLGNKGRTDAGDVQVMSAGSGIRHAEYNRESEPTRIFQIWIIPDRRGGDAELGRAAVPARGAQRPARRAGERRRRRRRRLADPRRRARARRHGSNPARRSNTGCARAARLSGAGTGAVSVNGVRVGERDGAAIRDEAILRLTAPEARPSWCWWTGSERSGAGRDCASRAVPRRPRSG